MTKVQEIECLLYCRGKKMEDSPPDEFSLEKVAKYFAAKEKFFPPADDPRVHVKTLDPTQSLLPSLHLNKTEVPSRWG